MDQMTVFLVCLLIFGVVGSVLILKHFEDGRTAVITVMLLVAGLLFAGHGMTGSTKYFKTRGRFWYENDELHLQYGGKKMIFRDLVQVKGTTQTSLFIRYGVLTLESEGRKCKLYSVPIDRTEDFSDSSLYPLYQGILEHDLYLQPAEENLTGVYCFRRLNEK